MGKIERGELILVVKHYKNPDVCIELWYEKGKVVKKHTYHNQE